MSPLLGAHVSIAGGMSRAISRGNDLDCAAIQVFVKNASQWKGKPISPEDARELRDLKILAQAKEDQYSYQGTAVYKMARSTMGAGNTPLR